MNQYSTLWNRKEEVVILRKIYGMIWPLSKVSSLYAWYSTSLGRETPPVARQIIVLLLHTILILSTTPDLSLSWAYLELPLILNTLQVNDFKITFWLSWAVWLAISRSIGRRPITMSHCINIMLFSLMNPISNLYLGYEMPKRHR